MAIDSGNICVDFSELSLMPSAKETIADTLTRAGFCVEHPCGGHGKCGKCLVRAVPAAAPTEIERRIIPKNDLDLGWRLSCLSPAVPGMKVFIYKGNEQILEQGALLQHSWNVRADGGKYRLAADIGTTTVVLYMLHPDDGRIITVVSAANSQNKYGADVISRIFAAGEDHKNLDNLKYAIIGTINGLIDEITMSTGVSIADISGLYAAGNTTMEHLLLGVDPSPIGRSPFDPPFLKAKDRNAAECGLNLSKEAFLRLVPNISAFVGGDITAGLYYTGVFRQPGTSLFIDIGTNSEMAVCRNGRIWACSAAAGPAFEGAHISTGLRAVNGAVEHASVEGDDLYISPIGGAPPAGICGSGIIDLVAVLAEHGVIEPSGKFADASKISSKGLARRIRRGNKNFSEFVYCFADEYGANKDLTLPQKDVREIQLAKSAIAVGIAKLSEKAGITPGELDRIYIGGAFGNFIDSANAMKLGVLPALPADKVTAAGNCAGLGVCRSAFDPEAEEAFGYICSHCESINLAELDDFQTQFVRNLKFGV